MRAYFLLLVFAVVVAAVRSISDQTHIPKSRCLHRNCVDVELHRAVANFHDENDGIFCDHGVASASSYNVIFCRGGGISAWIPAGYNPFGYKITELGESFLEFEGSLDSDVGRFLASLKARKKLAELKSQWLEIVRVSKSAQTMRIYRTIDDLIAFCIKARLLD